MNYAEIIALHSREREELIKQQALSRRDIAARHNSELNLINKSRKGAVEKAALLIRHSKELIEHAKLFIVRRAEMDERHATELKSAIRYIP
jgi:hypothetical protein